MIMNSRRLALSTVVAVLISSFTAQPLFAQQFSPAPATKAGSEFLFLAKTREKGDEKLKCDLSKLISDAKAGKVAPRLQPQLPVGKSHNLSKTAKIAIIAGVAVVVVGLVGWYAFTHGTECKSRCVL